MSQNYLDESSQPKPFLLPEDTRKDTRKQNKKKRDKKSALIGFVDNISTWSPKKMMRMAILSYVTTVSALYHAHRGYNALMNKPEDTKSYNFVSMNVTDTHVHISGVDDKGETVHNRYPLIESTSRFYNHPRAEEADYRIRYLQHGDQERGEDSPIIAVEQRDKNPYKDFSGDGGATEQVVDWAKSAKNVLLLQWKQNQMAEPTYDNARFAAVYKVEDGSIQMFKENFEDSKNGSPKALLVAKPK